MPDFSLLTDSLIELILCLAAFAFARFLHPRFFRGQESGRVVRQLSSRVRHHWPNSNISVKFHQTRSVKQPSHFWSLFLQHLDFAQLSKIIKTIGCDTLRDIFTGVLLLQTAENWQYATQGPLTRVSLLNPSWDYLWFFPYLPWSKLIHRVPMRPQFSTKLIPTSRRQKKAGSVQAETVFSK